MFEYVKDTGIAPSKPLAQRKKTDLILLHMSGSDKDTVKSMDAYHKSKGHKMIDYNFVVMPNGEVLSGRGLSAEGGSVNNSNYLTKGMNARSIAVCCVGDFTKKMMPEAQKNALTRLVGDLVNCFGLKDRNQIKTHREAAGYDYTDCPGQMFPVDEVRDFCFEQRQKKDKKWMVGVQNLNFRQQASLKSKIIGVLKYGEEVELDRYVDDEDWARVRTRNLMGYVWRTYLKWEEK